MESYKGIDHIKAAYKRKFTDRIPYYPITGSCNAKLIKRSIKEFLTDPKIFAQAQLEAFHRYHPDVVVMLSDLLMETEALGASLKFQEDAVCQCQEYLLQDKGKLGKLSIPNPLADARLPYFVEACKLVVSEVKEAAVGATICGPWAIAVSLRGAENLIFDTMDDPKYVHELMKLCTEVVKKFGDTVKETGVGVSLSEAPASCSLISPEIYTCFIKNYHKELVQYFQSKKTGLTIHVCGYIDPIMEHILDCGFSAISIDKPSSLEKILTLSNQKAVIIGNVATDAFIQENADELKNEVLRCIKAAKGKTAYILASGCEVPIQSLESQILKFKEICDHWCRYEVHQKNEI